MSETMTAEECRLRADLAEAMTSLRTTMGRMPEPIPDHGTGLVEAGEVLDEALRGLRQAETATTALEALQDLTEEAVRLVSASWIGLSTIEHLLALLFAEIDSSAAA